MANHRDLARELYATSLGRTSASRIWRTVVFAGAMLGAPLAAGCGSKAKPATTTTEQNQTTQGADQQAPGDDKAAADKAAEEKAAADKAAADKAAADAAAEEQAKKDEEERLAKEQADKEAADKAAAEAAKRPRGGGKRPTGRGFVLA